MSTKGTISCDPKNSAQKQSSGPPSRSSDLTSKPTQPVSLIQAFHLNSGIISPRNVMQLQKMIGNRATDKLLSKSGGLSFNRACLSPTSGIKPLQAKLTVSPGNDKYEREADQVAKQVVNRITFPLPQPVQRQGPEEEELQMMPFQRQPEEEEELMTKTERGSIQRQETKEEEEPQMKSYLQRQTEEQEEKELMTKPDVQRIGLEGGDADSDLEASIQQASGSGQPLPNSVREPVENALRADFSRVRIHTDSKANLLNSALQSRAFTTGSKIFFKQGEYNPGNTGGRELIAHELTHVLQQGAAKLKVSTNQECEKDE